MKRFEDGFAIGVFAGLICGMGFGMAAAIYAATLPIGQ